MQSCMWFEHNSNWIYTYGTRKRGSIFGKVTRMDLNEERDNVKGNNYHDCLSCAAAFDFSLSRIHTHTQVQTEQPNLLYKRRTWQPTVKCGGVNTPPTTPIANMNSFLGMICHQSSKPCHR